MENKEQNTERVPLNPRDKVYYEQGFKAGQSSQPINRGWVSVETIPTEQEINNLVESDLPNSCEYQKYDKEIQSLLMAATKAGAKWFRNSLIEGSYK
jgi:hypothetical protein